MMNYIEDLKQRQKNLEELHSPAGNEIYTPLFLVREVLDKLPENVWKNSNYKWLNPACKNGIWLSEVVVRLFDGLKDWEPDGEKRFNHIINNMVYGYAYSDVGVIVTRKTIYGNKNVVGNVQLVEYWKEEINMEFDNIIGNPPYQDGNQDGGQNKIYNLFSKKALEVGKKVLFITPTSVLKKSKRFSLIGQKGLKYVDFTAKNYFDVGVDICYWFVDKKYDDKINVRYENGNHIVDKNVFIYDYSKVDKTFVELYHKLKSLMDKPKKRMFAQNAVDAKHGRSKIKTLEFKYSIHKIDNNRSKCIQYNKPKPSYYDKLKFIISMTKSFDKAIIVDTKDYDVAHLCIEIDNMEEVENIKSFILSEYFKEHSKKWKIIDGYGYNYALKYLPPFDKTKKWTNDEVKEFIESFK